MSKYYSLTMMPSPGWQLHSSDIEVITNMGLSHVCSICTEEFVEEHGHLPKTLDDVMSTRCGAEMWFSEYDSYEEFAKGFQL